jgi:CheY-specific phosphatase CheX
MDLNYRLEATIEALQKETEIYLKDSLKLQVVSSQKTIETLETIEMRDMTVIIVLNGAIGFSIAFSFNRALSAEILKIEMSAYGLAIKESEYVLYIQSAIAEMVNIIIGRSCTLLQEEGKLINITTPMVIEKTGKLHRPKDASFSQLTIKTNYGEFDVNCIAPSIIFDKNSANNLQGDR